MTQKNRKKTPAFRLGFIEGFGAPGLLFAAKKMNRTRNTTATLASAWKDVDSAIRESFEKELLSDKATCKKIGSFGEAAE